MVDEGLSGSALRAPSQSHRTVAFGRVALPGIGYMMGSRRMVTTVMSPVNFIGSVGPREAWDPLSGTGTNRKEDKAHRDGIARYIQDNPDYVLNSLLVYMGTDDAFFEPDDAGAPISPGVLYVRPGAKFKVGDGGHRTSAYGDVIAAHQHGDEVLDRLTTNGQPIIVVLDDDHTRRAQDFTDLQNNSKPLNASIAQSMDRRQAINRLLIDRVIKPAVIPLVSGNRIEFLSDSPGKLSAKVMGFKTLRYATGTLLVGTGYRSTRSWEDAVAVRLAGTDEEESGTRMIMDFWSGMAQVPEITRALSVEKGVVRLREKTWLTSANVLYAIAAAVHDLLADAQREIPEVMRALSTIDFTRASTTFHGTLVDPETGKAVTGRDAWTSAAVMIKDRLEKALQDADAA